MLIPSAFPPSSGVTVDQVIADEGGVVGVLRATRPAVPCPMCGHLAHRVHSHYRRTVADLPVHGRALRLDLQTRRFWCDEPSCPRRIFAERFPQLVAPGTRRSRRLSTLYRALGLTLGGEAGARLAADLGLRVSPDTLVRATIALPCPAPPAPRVLGGDDWSWRKGRRWGTILVDLERHRTIDLVPDRLACTLACWLTARPSIAIVTRDRASAYAEGIRQGAPQVIQVADRFHLIKNAGEILERVVQCHHAALRAAATARDRTVAPSAGETTHASLDEHAETVAAPAPRPSAAQDRRRGRYEEVVKLAEQGLGPRAIGQRVGLTRQTIARWLARGTFPERALSARRPLLVTPYEAYLRERWHAGCQNSRQLWREVREQGFGGGHETVRRVVVQWRTERGRPGPPPRRVETAAPKLPVSPPAATRPLSPRDVRWLLIKEDEAMPPEQQAYLEQVRQRCPEVSAAQQLITEFLRVLRDRDRSDLDAWLGTAQACGVGDVVEFAKEVVRDRAAVDAALAHEWSKDKRRRRCCS